jgi:subfamily B ATP-binding cassette protein MsbA
MGIMVIAILLWYGNMVLIEKMMALRLLPTWDFSNILTPAKSISKASYAVKRSCRRTCFRNSRPAKPNYIKS